MKYKLFIILCLSICSISVQAQDTLAKKQRLDFAKTYFEYGGVYMPSFTSKRLLAGQVNTFTQSASLNEYLTWGAFHFWGHTEFYVTFPLKHNSLNKDTLTDYRLRPAVVTGGRFYPWAVKEKKLRPYVGLNWGALDFEQKTMLDEKAPMLTKSFMLNYEAGLTLNFKHLGFRISANYLPDNEWQYSIAKYQKETIKTPNYSFQFGILYAFESTKSGKKTPVEEWNSYPTISKVSYDAKKFGDIFLGVGPSGSFSLEKSAYNQSEFPFLTEKLVSKNYFDVAVGYQFNKWNLFTALSYRNPRYETSAYGVKQTIKKKSIALEVNKYLTDYTGFAPYIGLNIAYDKINYTHDVDGTKKEVDFSPKIEPGITVGWDIIPGKTSEAIVLRTNLRWYPLSNFEVDNKKFNFSQLEYNLIQVVFYPDRLKKSKK